MGESEILFSAGVFTSALFLFSLGIFAVLALRSRTLKSFQTQISIFIGIYLAGELLELNTVRSITGLPPDIGSQLHVLATIVVTTILWTRLFYSTRAVRSLVDKHDNSMQGSRT